MVDMFGDLSAFQNDPLFIAIVLWSLPWKIVSLWKAARNGHKGWYAVLFIVNLAGLLSILYIFYFSKNPDFFKKKGKNKSKKNS